MKRLIRLFIVLIFVFNTEKAMCESVKNCINCHPLDKFRGTIYHKPIDDCFSCHTAHVSKYPKLLVNKMPNLCLDCHSSILKEWKTFENIHYPVQKGECLLCHDSHSGGRWLLKNSIDKLCQACHDIEMKRKFLHQPFVSGNCNACHISHGSNEGQLLKRKDICIECHPLQGLKRTHRNIDNGAGCTTCHNPHGGNNKSLLMDKVHRPYKEGRCDVCHFGKAQGNQMCLSCHPNVENEFFSKYNHYLPTVENKPFCVECHSPHVAEEKGLIKVKIKSLCVSCHKEVVIQKEESLYVHNEWDNCIVCHNPHGSNVRAMLKDKDVALCGKCHSRHVNFAHPMGEKVRDPRNGQPTSCITCHDPMGTNYKYQLRLSGDKALCIECHKGY